MMHGRKSIKLAHKAVAATQNIVFIVRNNPLMQYRDIITPYCVGIMQVILVLWHVAKAKFKLTILTPFKQIYGRGKYSYKHSELFHYAEDRAEISHCAL
jgi:hypothetical protein